MKRNWKRKTPILYLDSVHGLYVDSLQFYLEQLDVAVWELSKMRKFLKREYPEVLFHYTMVNKDYTEEEV